MTEADRAEWRAAGLRAGAVYGDDLAVLMHGRDAGDAQVRNLMEVLSLNLRAEAQRLRGLEVSEELIDEYARAAVESVMLRMQALREGPDARSDSHPQDACRQSPAARLGS
ncbi:hypothetical protein [Methylobacterium flocculans]|uniref:hypothetical protein n=1 Tax=Methylobacterium flocculans TaxID=2984843 RepID=UPI0021F35C42|nr:hypothetical protein [Methylobacterium sp. FF17]